MLYFWPVSERCDDQSLSAAQELILVLKVYICDRDDTLVCVLIEVKPWLFEPLKVCRGLDV